MAGKNNIFAIDFDAVVEAVKEANEQLKIKHLELMSTRGRMPATLKTGDEIARAKKYAEIIKGHISLCRAMRLSDTKPLKELVKRVEVFFKGMETEAKSTQEAVLEVLGDTARRSFSPPQGYCDDTSVDASFFGGRQHWRSPWKHLRFNSQSPFTYRRDQNVVGNRFS